MGHTPVRACVSTQESPEPTTGAQHRWPPPPPPRRPRPPSRPRTTARTTCRSSRASRRSASAPACTSGPPTVAASCTASGRSSTTRSTRRWPGVCDHIEVDPLPRRLGRGARQRPRHPGRHRAAHRPHRCRGGLHQAARGWQVRRRLLHRLRWPARRRARRVVNALSARLDVEVDRGGNTYAMSFRRGEPGYFPDVADRRQGARPRRSRPYERSSELRGRRQDQARGHRHAGSATGPTSRSSSRTPSSTTTGWSPAPARPPSSSPG